MATSLEHRTQALRQCLTNLYVTPVATWFSVMLSALILSMPIGFFMTFSNLEFFSFLIQQQPQATAFLARDVEHSTAVSMQQRIQALDDVYEAKLFSADDSLADFEALTGLYSVSNYLQENPFPATIEVSIAAKYSNPQDYAALLSQIQSLEYVDLVQFDHEWAAKLHSLRNILVWFGAVAIGLSILVVIFLIVFMNRRQVLYRTKEIKLLSLIGASRRFIYRPFVYTALIQSLLIAAVTFGIVETIQHYAEPTVSGLVSLYQIESLANSAHWDIWALILLALILINVVTIRLAVYLQVRKH